MPLQRGEKKLTEKESSAVWRVLDAIIEKLTFDEEMEAYTDPYGDIIICLDKEDFKAIKRAYKKL